MDDSQEKRQAIVKVLERLARFEKRQSKILGDFERRMHLMHELSTRTSKLASALKNSKDFKNKATQLKGTYSKLGHTLDIPDELKEISKEEIELIDKEIERNKYYVNVDKSKSLSAFSRLANELANILAVECEEKQLLKEIDQRISQFFHMIQNQKDKIQNSLNVLRELETSQFIADNRKEEITFMLKRNMDEIERLLRGEKEAIHEPLDVLLNKDRYAKRMAKKAFEEGMTRDRIKSDIKSFSRDDEYITYVQELVMLSDRAKKKLPKVLKYTPAILRDKLLKNRYLDDETKRLLIKGTRIAANAARSKHYESNSLNKLAYFDQLTGIFNRHSLEMHVKKIYANMKRSYLRSGKVKRLCVMMIDIDKFKSFNDEYGHNIGDKVLKSVANILKRNIRDGCEFAARYGGEEFIVIIPDTDKKTAIRIAERLRQKVETETAQIMKEINNSVKISNRRTNVTISIGLAMFPEQNEKVEDFSFEGVKARADKRLYLAKNQGRNQIAAYSLRTPVLRRRQIKLR